MERDDLIVNDSYALNAHHSEEEGVIIRKKIVKVTVILTIITIIEVALGIVSSEWGAVATEVLKWSFIGLTLVKAAYIVMSFMHLGDERKNLKYVILLPYAMFIAYLIFICLVEADYLHWILGY
jgi:cytochrome c oxidase subunit IV